MLQIVYIEYVLQFLEKTGWSKMSSPGWGNCYLFMRVTQSFVISGTSSTPTFGSGGFSAPSSTPSAGGNGQNSNIFSSGAAAPAVPAVFQFGANVSAAHRVISQLDQCIIVPNVGYFVHNAQFIRITPSSPILLLLQPYF